MNSQDSRMAAGPRWVLALSSAVSFMVSLDSQVVATALPVIQVHLHASLAALEWTVNAYTLTFAVLLLTGAAVGERLGRRRMLATGVGVFTLASAACALAPDAGVLIAARALQGAGAALMLPLALASLSAAYPPQRRAWALGIFSSVTGIAVLAGPVVGGAITQGLAWTWIFWLNVPIGVIMIPLILTRMPAAAGPRTQLDPLGLLLATGGALALVWGLIRANSVGWASPQIARGAGGRGTARGRLRGLGTAGQPPDGPGPHVRPAGLRGRERRHLRRVRHAVRPGVLHGPVPAGRSRLRPARRRPAAAARVGHAGHDRAVRRPAHRPRRRAHTDRGRPDRGRGRAGLDRADRPDRLALRRAGCPAGHYGQPACRWPSRPP